MNADRALDLFRRGFSCSQAVFTPFAEAMGLDRDAALRLSQPFGGGIARRGSLCGALTGGLLAIGLKHGRTRPDDDAARDTTYRLSREFMDRFARSFGAADCRDLLGCDIGTPAGAADAEARGLHAKVCEKVVAGAVRMIEEVLAEAENPAD